MKKVFVYLSLILIAVGIVNVFWEQELVYSLPTPVPQDLKQVEVGKELVLAFDDKKHEKPVFLHFFNPACPCSRFNMKHFKKLLHTYSDKLDFMVVVQTEDLEISDQEIKDEFDIDVPCIMDPDKKIAESCGVYSTPQAVIIDMSGKLYYRGNYNRARYCTDKKSDFAQMAIDSLLNNQDNPVFSMLATIPYGCSLPAGCGK